MLEFDLPTRTDLVRLKQPTSPAEHVNWKKQNRKSQVLNLLRLHGPLSRVEIASRLGFYFQRASSFVDELIAEGLVFETERVKPSSAGRPPTPVALNAKAACVLGVEIARSAVRVLIMDLSGTIIQQAEMDYSLGPDADSCAEVIEQFVVETVSICSEPLPPLAGIGIGSTGLLYQSGGETHFTRPVTRAVWERLEARFGVPVLRDSDSCMLSLGELWFGQTRDLQTFAVLNISDGLGSGLIVGRHYFRGGLGRAGDLGHVRVGSPAVACYCGGESCLETIASGYGLKRMAVEKGIFSGANPGSVAELARLAREGMPEALAVFDQFADGVAKGVGLITTLFSPQAVILSGPVSRYADLFIDRVRQKTQGETLSDYLEDVRIEVSQLCERAVSLGTCARVLHQIFCPSETN